MKLFSRISLGLVAFLSFYSCKEDLGVKPKDGSISFSYATHDRIAGGRITTDMTPTSIIVTISDNNDNAIVTDKKISLISFGSSYILNSPIQLPVGPKKLKKFIVLNSSNESIYAAPVRGSQLASLVNNPLDIPFDVTPNATTNVEVEVVPVLSSDDPGDFGLATFSFHIVDRLPRLKEMMIFDGGVISRETFQYTGNTTIPSSVFFYNCTDSAMQNCLLTDSWETVIDTTGKIASLKNSSFNVLDQIQSWTYDADGSLKTFVSKSAQTASGDGGASALEDFYYKSNGQLDYSILRHTSSANFNGYIRQYSYGTDGNVSKIETRYCTVFNGNLTIREQYVTEEYLYDNHPTNAMLYNDLYFWAPIFSPLTRKNNITWTRFTSYTLTGPSDHIVAVVDDVVEITRTYEYNSQGLPVKETVSIPGYNGFTYESDGMVKRFTYIQ